MTRLSAAHFRALRTLAVEVSRAADSTSAGTLIQARLASMLDTEVVLVRRRLPPTPKVIPLPPPQDRPARAGADGSWEVPADVGFFADQRAGPAAAPAVTPLPLPFPSEPDSESVLLPHALRESVTVDLGTCAGESWSLVLGGRWESKRSRAFIAELADSIPAALAAPDLRGRLARAEHVVASAYAFSRQLSTVHGAYALRQFIVDTMAVATRARLGSLALYDADEGSLSIAATHGYPAVFVEHVRLAPGEGVLGRVFEGRRSLLVRDVRDVPGLHARRPRYRTPSFLAVPLMSAADVLGVVTFADREDAQPFDESDLTAARALAAPAALALMNDRLTTQTKQLALAATIDPLTGLFNRRYFHTRIDEEIQRSKRHSLDLALLLIDIDDFKKLNDTLGHLAGDYLLRQVSDVLKRSVRVFDVCTRYGGEEFAILMPGSSASNALMVAERIRSRVEASARDEGPLPTYLRITVSLGLAVLGTDNSSTELIARADRALYRAKAEGKNRVRMD